jgi:hypothetical protein
MKIKQPTSEESRKRPKQFVSYQDSHLNVTMEHMRNSKASMRIVLNVS